MLTDKACISINEKIAFDSLGRFYNQRQKKIIETRYNFIKSPQKDIRLA